jgi:hypothetical protein
MSADSKRFLNASQLYGFSGECALKAVMVGLGLPTRADGTVSDTRLYSHLPGLWNQFALFAAGSVGAHYLAVASSAPPLPAPFSTWDVNDRYGPNTTGPARDPEFSSHRESAKDLIALLELAIEDGII